MESPDITFDESGVIIVKLSHPQPKKAWLRQVVAYNRRDGKQCWKGDFIRVDHGTKNYRRFKIRYNAQIPNVFYFADSNGKRFFVLHEDSISFVTKEEAIEILNIEGLYEFEESQVRLYIEQMNKDFQSITSNINAMLNNANFLRELRYGSESNLWNELEESRQLIELVKSTLRRIDRDTEFRMYSRLNPDLRTIMLKGETGL
jgi:hypothetical protein